jgi:putative ATP-dependent endonuclease of OLD family
VVFDGDAAGRGYANALTARGFDPAFIAQRCRTHAAGHLEDQLLADGLEPELRSILQALGQNDADALDPATLQIRLADNKIPYAAQLATRVNGDAALAHRPFGKPLPACEGSYDRQSP